MSFDPYDDEHNIDDTVVLSPKGPPPTFNVFQHQVTPKTRDEHIETKSPLGSTRSQQQDTDVFFLDASPSLVQQLHGGTDRRSELSHLTRRRLLDPVFRAPEAKFPVMMGESSSPARSSPTRKGNTILPNNALRGSDDHGMIRVFDPSAIGKRCIQPQQQEQQEDETKQISKDVDKEELVAERLDEMAPAIEPVGVDDVHSIEEETEKHSFICVENEAGGEVFNGKRGPEDYVVVDEPEETTCSPPVVLDSIPTDGNPNEADPEKEQLLASEDEIVEETRENSLEVEDGEVQDPTQGEQQETETTERQEADDEPILVERGDSLTGNERQVENNRSTGQEKSTISSNMIVETPDRAIKQSKFIFLSDQKELPTDLKKLHEHTMRRRRDMLARMHDLDLQLARLTSKYAEEKMDLDLAVRDNFDRTICHPLEAAAERLVMERESSTSRAPAVAGLEQRLAQLDQEMTCHVYETLYKTKHDELDVLRDDFFQEIIPGTRIENSKSDKIEGGVVRRFEEVAGMLTKRFHGESAARRASIVMLQKKLETVDSQDEQEAEDIFAQISFLRAQIKEERAERQAADKEILDEICRTTESVKRALLELVGGISR